MQRYQSTVNKSPPQFAANISQKVPCQFELNVPYLGHLNNSSGLEPGTSILLPLWLAEMLALASTGEDRQAPLTLNLPPCLSDQVMNALKAEPRAIALRDQSAYFYEIGVRMLDLFDEKELGVVLRKTFAVRAQDVGSHARKAEDGSSGQGEEFLRGLDEWERNLFRKGHEGVRGAKDWMDKVKRS
jgi:GINS complex subunit 3